MLIVAFLPFPAKKYRHPLMHNNLLFVLVLLSLIARDTLCIHVIFP